MDAVRAFLAWKTLHQAAHWSSFSRDSLKMIAISDVNHSTADDTNATRSLKPFLKARSYPSLAVDHSIQQMHATVLSMLRSQLLGSQERVKCGK
jgi:hypothetical protein